MGKNNKKTPANPAELVEGAAATTETTPQVITCEVEGCEGVLTAEGADCATCAEKAELKRLEDEETARLEQEAADKLKEEEEKAAAVKVAPTPIKADNLTKLNGMLAEYKETASCPAVTPKVQALLVEKLGALVAFVVAHPETKLLQAMFDFFVKERKGLLSEDVALAGINRMAKGSRAKLEVFYGAFSTLVRSRLTGKKKSINMDIIREVLKSEEIVSFLASKNGK